MMRRGSRRRAAAACCRQRRAAESATPQPDHRTAPSSLLTARQQMLRYAALPITCGRFTPSSTNSATPGRTVATVPRHHRQSSPVVPGFLSSTVKASSTASGDNRRTSPSSSVVFRRACAATAEEQQPGLQRHLAPLTTKVRCARSCTAPTARRAHAAAFNNNAGKQARHSRNAS